MNNKVAIVVVAYNRIKSLKRLLDSLNKVDYLNNNIDLLISIDKGDNIDILDYANDFRWEFGNKKVIYQENNLGLRKHILSVGRFLNRQYEALIVLEDDIYVSPEMFNYSIKAIEKYKEDDNIAGISLYSHELNPLTKSKFDPIKTKFDTYFLQYAQSWGQIWLSKQWREFITWYNKQEDYIWNDHVPENVNSWPRTSWLKYHIKYCIENNKYFVYPYKSLTTNFTDKGEHNKSDTNIQQVSLSYELGKKYNFPNFLDKDVVYYDAYFENIGIKSLFNVNPEELTIDLGGNKPKSIYAKYLLTTKNLNYKIIQSFDLVLHPKEMNIINKMSGFKIKLYDTSLMNKNKFLNNMEYESWLYDNKYINPIFLPKYFVKYLTNHIKSKFKY